MADQIRFRRRTDALFSRFPQGTRRRLLRREGETRRQIRPQGRFATEAPASPARPPPHGWDIMRSRKGEKTWAAAFVRKKPDSQFYAADKTKNTGQATCTRLVPCFAQKVFGESARGPFFKRVLSFVLLPAAAAITKNTGQATCTRFVPCFAIKVFGESARGPFFQKGSLVRPLIRPLIRPLALTRRQTRRPPRGAWREYRYTADIFSCRRRTGRRPRPASRRGYRPDF